MAPKAKAKAKAVKDTTKKPAGATQKVIKGPTMQESPNEGESPGAASSGTNVQPAWERNYMLWTKCDWVNVTLPPSGQLPPGMTIWKIENGKYQEATVNANGWLDWQTR